MSIWDHVVKDIDSSIDNLAYMMEYGVTLMPYVTVYNDNGHFYYMVSVESELMLNYNDKDAVRCTEAISWVTEQLSSWPGCHLLSANLWRINDIEDVEKFKILFLLKWT